MALVPATFIASKCFKSRIRFRDPKIKIPMSAIRSRPPMKAPTAMPAMVPAERCFLEGAKEAGGEIEASGAARVEDDDTYGG